MVNQELFQKIHDVLTLTPEQHDQGLWEIRGNDDNHCQTTRCVAGWALYLHAEEKGVNVNLPMYRLLHLLEDEFGFVPNYDEAGERLLGLTPEEAHFLFYASNDLAREAVESYALKGSFDWDGAQDKRHL